MDTRVGEGASSARRACFLLSSVFPNLLNITAALARPGPAIKFLTVFSVIVLLAQIPAQALISPTSTVGATPGTFAVSPSGAATYTIPIVVPPGTNGMRPNLALVYNSQSGNGLLGMGWSLSGLSVIHRCGATIEIDGFKGGVNYDGNDRFCLDGERLISIGNNEYRTRHESLQKVVAVGADPTNPTHFFVTDKDGAVRAYGTTTNSRIEAQGKNSIRIWALDRFTDKNSNSLTISYQEDNANGDYRPDSIAYGENAAAGSSNHSSVTFEYSGRSDAIPFYQGGSVIKTQMLLTKITTKTGTQTVREYSLQYDFDGQAEGTAGRARLKAVQECGTDGICLPPTTLAWQDSPIAGFQDAGHSALGLTDAGGWNTGQRYFLIDVNGDGKGDIVIRTASGTFQSCLSTGAGFSCAGNTATPFNDNDGWNEGQRYFQFDADGDGLGDLVMRGAYGNFFTYLSDGTQLVYKGTTPTWFNDYDGWNIGIRYFLMDVDGDGRGDLVMRGGDGSLHTFLSVGSTFAFAGTTQTGLSDVGGWNSGHRFFQMDVNGDGRGDLVARAGNGSLLTYLSNGSGFTYVSETSTSFNDAGGWNSGLRYFQMDVNGDGKGDLVMRAADGALLTYLSNGVGFTQAGATSTSFNDAGGWNSGLRYFQMDVNGDGKGDLVMRAENGALRTYLSNGTGFTDAGDTPTSFNDAGGWNTGQRYFQMDVNGDGKGDLVMRAADGVFLSYTSVGPIPDVLTSTTNGLGLVTNVAYKPITDGDVYTNDVGTNAWDHRYVDLQAPIYVVEEVNQSNGIGGTNTTTYRYAGLKTHSYAATSLGFRLVESTDAAGITHRILYNQNRERGIDGTVGDDLILGPGDVLLKSTTNTWDLSPSSGVCGGTRQPQLFAVVEKTFELDGTLVTQTNVNNLYDTCGFPTSIVTDFNDGWRKTVTNSYQNDTANWILGRITQAQVMAEAPNQAAKTRTSSFAYRPDGLMQSETIEPGNSALSVTTTYDYDAFGNRKLKTVSGTDIATRTEQYEYGLQYQGRFLTKKINAAGHITTYDTYDERNGQVKKMTDPNGLVTQWDYDGFGRKGLEIRPNGKTSTMAYLPGTDQYGGQGYSVVVTTEGAGDSETFYDSLGRAYKWRTKGFSGNDIFKRIVHDNLGRVIFKSHPEFGAPSTHGVDYEYDILGRVEKITEPGPTPRETTTVYNGLTTTVTNALGQVTTTTKNSQGKPISVTQAEGTADAGTTQYEYDPFLNLTKVIDPAGNPTTMAYDDRGRKIGMSDPDMGTWSYKYDVLGELTEQKDAITLAGTRNQTITMEYDVLGRMKNRTVWNGASSETSTWTYDTAPYAKGKLIAVSGAGGYTESHAYNSLSLPSSSTYNVAGTGYTVGRSYDDFSRLEIITYPSGYTVKQIYDDFGYLHMVNRLDGASESLIWQTDIADAHARVVREVYGNNLESVRGYDHETNDLMTIQTGINGSGAPTIQNLAYTYDNLHNLKSRNDTITGLNEAFDYDDLNRLKQATGAVTKTYSYNSIGNIITKSDVGTYSYPTNGVRPHAVTSVAGVVNATYTYDANGNMLSGAGRTITYTSFNKPQSITSPSGSVTLAYDANYHRVQKFAGSKTTSYIGKLFEREVEGTLTQDKNYVYAGGSLVAIFTHRNNLIDDTKYVHTDHLGSVNVITDENGAVIPNGRFSYDPHGKRRQTNGQDATGPIVSDVNRGFTRHEHDDEVGLINMNARLYDPLLGRFITPDSMTEGPAGQGLNRYSYVRNNPLTLTDPTGHWSLSKAFKRLTRSVKRFAKKWGRTIVAAVAAYYTFNAVSGWLQSSVATTGTSTSFASAGTFIGTDTAGGFFTTSLTTVGGATAGAASGFVSGGIMSGNLQGAWRGATGGAISGGLYAGAGILSRDWNAFGQMTARSVVGGTLSQLQGGKFADGFARSFGIETLSYAALEMRRAMFEQSCQGGPSNPNCSGESVGFRGIGGKLGGARCIEGGGCPSSLLGGRQGGKGVFLGSEYASGSFRDQLVEAFAGPHDMFDSFMYNSSGNLNPAYAGGIGRVFGEAVSWMNVAPASVFVAGSVLQPLIPYADTIEHR